MKKNNKKSLVQANRLLARQWHPARNAPLTPDSVTPGCGRRVWWLCAKGHEWEATVNNRNSGMGCPYCAKRKAAPDNCLLTINPKLAREWHPAKNDPLTPQDVVAGSSKQAWWQCEKGHEWKTSIILRNNGGTGCPYCAGSKASKENCLKIKQPELARQWHPTKNAGLTPKDVTACAGKKVWWLCEKGHQWQAYIYSRNAGAGCPYCAGQRVTKENSLQTTNPGLAKEWHPRKNAPLTPKDVIPGSNKRVWWRCPKGHEWQTKISHRSRLGSGCPYCAGKKVSKDNCLRTVNPGVAREWHPTKNAPLTPGHVTASSGKKVWWKCKNGHEWKAEIAKRNYGSGCACCSGSRPTEENSLEVLRPWLARDWHSTKNDPWTPKDVSPFSTRLIWWKCGKGHEVRERVIERYKRGGCPVCTLKARVPQLFEKKSDL